MLQMVCRSNACHKTIPINSYRNTILKEKLQPVLICTSNKHYRACSQILTTDALQLSLRPTPKYNEFYVTCKYSKLTYKYRWYNQKTTLEHATGFPQSSQHRFPIHATCSCILLVITKVNTTQVTSRPAVLTQTRSSLVYSTDQYYVQQRKHILDLKTIINK
jgi:hypothetical protein